jgi:hypothetical protein
MENSKDKNVSILIYTFGEDEPDRMVSHPANRRQTLVQLASKK